MKQKKLSFDEVAKTFHNPKMFKEETVKLSIDFQVYLIKYGKLGLKELEKMIIFTSHD